MTYLDSPRTKMNTTLVLATALSCVATATAQGAISNANVSYELFGIPTAATGFGSDAPRIQFTADAAAGNVAHSFWWYYRVAGDTNESAFNSSGGQIVRNTFVNKTGTLEWADVDGRGFSATSLTTVASESATTGAVVHVMTVRNDGVAPLTIDLFAYCDLDHCATTPGDSAAGTAERHAVSNPSCLADTEFYGVQPDHYTVGTWPTVLDQLVDGAASTLSDTGLPYGPGDYSAAMQFTSPVLQPGESFLAIAAISHGSTFTDCGVSASWRNFGNALGGAGGAPTLTATTAAVVGSNLIFAVDNAPPSANGVLLYGNIKLNGDLGFNLFGLDFYVAQFSESAGSDVNGQLRLQLDLPLKSTGLCGQTFTFQFFFSDATSPAAIPLVHTDALEFTIGM